MDRDLADMRECVMRALAEDLAPGPASDAAIADRGTEPAPDRAPDPAVLGRGEARVQADVTSRLSVPAGRSGRAQIRSKADGVLAGIDCARLAFELLDPACRVSPCLGDGDRLATGDLVLEVAGPLHALLAGERTALNFLQRLSGIATSTRAFVDAVDDTGARILDTRKTTPGLRVLEKRAVLAGGGDNHRFGLFDQVLLKENHFASAREGGRSYRQVVRACVEGQSAPVVAEARTVGEALDAVAGGAAVVLLDNFLPDDALSEAVAAVRRAAAQAGRAVVVEASGGISIGNVRAFAERGVDRISIGALTHSSPALDLSMLITGLSEPEPQSGGDDRDLVRGKP